MSTELHTKSYSNNRPFFQLTPCEDIAENDPVRVVDALVEHLAQHDFKRLYRERGRCAYHPRMMLRVILYAYMNSIYSCRKIEQRLHRAIHYIWLAAQERPDYMAIKRVRNREINRIFTQLALLLADRGFISLELEYIDGTKMEPEASKCTFAWRETVGRHRAKPQEGMRALLQQVDDAIARDNTAESEPVAFTPESRTSLIGAQEAALASEPEPAGEEGPARAGSR